MIPQFGIIFRPWMPSALLIQKHELCFSRTHHCSNFGCLFCSLQVSRSTRQDKEKLFGDLQVWTARTYQRACL